MNVGFAITTRNLAHGRRISVEESFQCGEDELAANSPLPRRITRGKDMLVVRLVMTGSVGPDLGPW